MDLIIGALNIAHVDDAIHAAITARALGFGDMTDRIDAALDVVHEETRQRFDDWGAGDWPELAESTIARKASQGYPEPDRPLYAEGDLFESATSDSGPYSYRHVESNWGVIGVDWTVDGRQIPPLLSAGNDATNLPARPIWPHDELMIAAVKRALQTGSAF